MKKSSVAIDIINLGIKENDDLLNDFMKKVNNEDNSSYLSVPNDCYDITNLLSKHTIVTRGGAAAPNMDRAGFGIGTDPKDPEPSELSEPIRLSLQDQDNT